MSELLISSFMVSDVSESLISLKSNERFAQVAQRKWAIMSKLLRPVTKNEQMSESLIFLSESLICKFLDKKRVVHLEIKWANSQPWCNISKNLRNVLEKWQGLQSFR